MQNDQCWEIRQGVCFSRFLPIHKYGKKVTQHAHVTEEICGKAVNEA